MDEIARVAEALAAAVSRIEELERKQQVLIDVLRTAEFVHIDYKPAGEVHRTH